MSDDDQQNERSRGSPRAQPAPVQAPGLPGLDGVRGRDRRYQGNAHDSVLHARELCHPLVVSAVAVLLVNDHLLKGAGVLPGVVTGKLSDVAGLFFFPILLVVLGRVCWVGASSRPFPRRAAAWSAMLVTCVGFGAIKLSETVNAIAGFWGIFVMDPTDLLCLPMTLLAVAWLEHRWQSPPQRSAGKIAQFAVVLCAAFGTIATPAPPVRNYPHWEIHDVAENSAGVVEMSAWVAKSGKEGVGVMIEATNTTDTPRSVQFSNARLELLGNAGRIDTNVRGRAPGAPIVVGPDDPERVYMPFRFDNEAAWNAGKRHADVVVEIRVDDQPAQRWRMRAVHAFDSRTIRHDKSQRFPYAAPDEETR